MRQILAVAVLAAGGAAASAQEVTYGRLRVVVPADAVLTINGHRSQNLSGVRVIQTQENLEPGRNYEYDLEATVVRNGQTYTERKRVAVTRGVETAATFYFPAQVATNPYPQPAQPSNPQPGQPSYPQPGQPYYPPQGQGYPPQGQPYPAQGQPFTQNGFPQPGFPGGTNQGGFVNPNAGGNTVRTAPVMPSSQPGNGFVNPNAGGNTGRGTYGGGNTIPARPAGPAPRPAQPTPRPAPRR